MLATLLLTGEDLTLEDVWQVAVERAPIGLSDAATRKMEAARELVDEVAREDHTYGVNTGFGRFVSETIAPEQVEELQLRLLRSHSCGVGDPYPDAVVRAAMLLRANALAKGYSGARPATVELLIECLNRGVLPRVPSRGSVGASGDLAPLAHLALPLVGEGEAWFDGELLPGADALAAAGLEPTRLGAKEGLSLINGTQFMAAMCSLALDPCAPARADCGRRLRHVARGAAGLADELPARRSTRAAARVARPTRPRTSGALLDGSAIIESHRWCDQVQDAYSLRCAPQVHGACARPARLRRRHRRRRAQRRHRQSARPRRRGQGRLERELPRPAARVRARRARDGGRRAGEHLRAAGRATRQPEPLRGTAAVPHASRAASTPAS